MTSISAVKPANHFTQQSDDIKLHILSFLGINDLGNSALVCREWSKLCANQRIWRPMVVRQFPQAHVQVLNEGKDSRAAEHPRRAVQAACGIAQQNKNWPFDLTVTLTTVEYLWHLQTVSLEEQILFFREIAKDLISHHLIPFYLPNLNPAHDWIVNLNGFFNHTYYIKSYLRKKPELAKLLFVAITKCTNLLQEFNKWKEEMRALQNIPDFLSLSNLEKQHILANKMIQLLPALHFYKHFFDKIDKDGLLYNENDISSSLYFEGINDQLFTSLTKLVQTESPSEVAPAILHEIKIEKIRERRKVLVQSILDEFKSALEAQEPVQVPLDPPRQYTRPIVRNLNVNPITTTPIVKHKACWERIRDCIVIFIRAIAAFFDCCTKLICPKKIAPQVQPIRLG